MINDRLKESAKELVIGGKLKKALELIKANLKANSNWREEVDQLITRINAIEKQIRLGNISFQESSIIKNKINHDFQQLLDTQEGSKLINVKKRGFRYLTLAIGFISTIILILIYFNEKKNCLNFYQTGEFADAKSCFESKLLPSQKREILLTNCALVIKGDAYFFNSDYPKAFESYSAISDSVALNLREEHIIDCGYYISALESIHVGRYPTALNQLEKLLESKILDKLAKEDIEKLIINTRNKIITEPKIDKKELAFALSLYEIRDYANSYRAYLKLYNSLPINAKAKIDLTKIKDAKQKYKIGNWREAAWIMKNVIEESKIEFLN